jgi:hypothetical protein
MTGEASRSKATEFVFASHMDEYQKRNAAAITDLTQRITPVIY